MLNYGQNPDDPVVSNLRLNPNIGTFVGKWSEQLSRAKVCLQAAQDRMKCFADKHRSPTPEFSPGDLVLLNVKNFRLQSGLCRKLAPRFAGPFKVLKAVGKAKLAYRLELPSNLRIHPVFHVSALKAYNYFPGNYTPPPLPSLIDGLGTTSPGRMSKTSQTARRSCQSSGRPKACRVLTRCLTASQNG